MTNSLRGEFEAAVGGETIRFDTRLGTIASIEDRCGDLPIVEIVNKAVFGRRARDRIALLAAAILAAGRAEEEAEALAGLATVPEAEAFILALMGALGFEVARVRGEETERPLDGASTGAAGANSASAACTGPRTPSGIAPGPVSATPGTAMPDTSSASIRNVPR